MQYSAPRSECIMKMSRKLVCSSAHHKSHRLRPSRLLVDLRGGSCGAKHEDTCTRLISIVQHRYYSFIIADHSITSATHVVETSRLAAAKVNDLMMWAVGARE